MNNDLDVNYHGNGEAFKYYGNPKFIFEIKLLVIR